MIPDTETHKDIKNIEIDVSIMPHEVKLECEEVEDEEISQCYRRKRVLHDECQVSDSATKKRRLSRRRESIKTNLN